MKTETRLDYATFQLDEARTRCELWVTALNETEKLASGSLKPFLTHLRAAQEQIARADKSSIKLQVPHGTRTSWFTKGTVERFVRFVTTPDVLERVSIVETERRQLEEAINILAAGDQQARQSTGSMGLEGEDPVDGDVAGDNSKNQLLVAMDARRIMLQKEQLNAFARAAAAGFDVGCMPDLIEFSNSFGAARLRDACLKFASIYKRMQEKGQLSDLEADSPTETGEDAAHKNNKVRRTWTTQDKDSIDHLHQSQVEPALDDMTNQPQQQPEAVPPVSEDLYASPAKAQPEDFRVIPDSPPNIMDADSPSTEGKNSQQDTPTSRRLPRRVSSPRRRSCSPMRRVQIARPGSRRPGMVVIRNINYTSPGLQDSAIKPPPVSDSTEESDSVQETEDNKEERQKNKERRLSVQDAISLFERKQRDSLEGQKVEPRRASMDPANSGKSVLRRWSGISDTSSNAETADSSEKASSSKDDSLQAESKLQQDQTQILRASRSPSLQDQHYAPSSSTPQEQLTSVPRVEERRKSWVTAQNDLEWKFQQLKLQEAALPAMRSSKDIVHSSPPPQSNAVNTQFGFQYRGQKISRSGPVSRSWSATSEKDLLTLVRQAEMATEEQNTPQGKQQKINDQGGRFYEQYRERRDAKIRQESDLKRAERESKLKAMQEILDRRKAELVAGSRSTDKFTDRQVKTPASLTRKGLQQVGRATGRSSPTVPPSQVTPRASRQQLPPEPRSTVARKLSPGSQKPAPGPGVRGVSSSPKLPKSSTAAAIQRRPANMSDNPLSRSMPSLSELRKENTRPSVRSGSQVSQPSKVAPAKNTKSGGNAVRQKTVSKVLPLEPNGVVSSDFAVQPPKDNAHIVLKKKPSTPEDDQILTPLKQMKDIQAQASPRIVTPKQIAPVAPFHEPKPFLRKGRGIGPGAGPVVMKLKAASTSETEEDKPQDQDEHDLSQPSDGLPVDTPVATPAIEPEEQRIPGSVRESQEMDIDSSSNEATEQNAETSNDYMAADEGTVSTRDVMVDEPVKIVKSEEKSFATDIVSDTSNKHEGSADWIDNKARKIAEAKLTLMQQLATEEYVETTALSDRRSSLASVGSSSPCSSTASGVPQLRHSLSPDLDAVKPEKQRRKWGSSHKPAMISQKHQQHQGNNHKEEPKGFKRLLKFGRKSRGNNTSEWVSASTTSEGDEDTDDTGSFNNGSSYLRRSTEAFSKEHDVANGNGSRSFFSLSSFRSSKAGGDSKTRS